MARKSNRRCDALPILHPDAAGIDVGASDLYVAVSAERDQQPVRRFPLSLVICMHWLTGSSSAGFTLSQWSPPACIGFLFTRSWKRGALKSIW
jgi:hypothetical protein